MFIQHYKSCRKIKGSKSLTLNGIRTWWCLLLARGARWALCICHVFGFQIIFETQRTSMVTHFMLTVGADNFCPMDRTIWQCFESKFAVHKSFLHFLSITLFSPPCFSRTANPASSSSDSLSYSFATLWIKTTGPTNGRKSYNARFFCF